MTTPPAPLDPESFAALKLAPFDLELEPFPEPFWVLFKECTPRILVVTDNGLSFSSSDGFGLSQFVATLEATPVHGMLPEVKTAHRGTDTSADVQNFVFDSTISKSKYDVIFLFGFEGEGSTHALSSDELEVVETFMEAGGGVFATGDHEEIGAGLCGKLPRVRSMRHWYAPDAPPMSSPERITTNSPGDNGIFEFADQSDAVPQKIYPRYYESASSPWESAPHALLQAPPVSGSGSDYEPIEVAPDHPHEGECVEPSSLTGTFVLGGKDRAEWPAKPGTKTVPAPQVVAFGVTYGGAFTSPNKEAVLAPRTFGVVGAYDGHEADVGRVAVDSTWHHFVNINIDGTGSSRDGLRESLVLWPGMVTKPFPVWPGFLRDTHALTLIRTYWGNLASWLMPETTRMCLSIGKFLVLADSPTLVEELVGWSKSSSKRKQALELARLGELVVSLLAERSTPAATEQALDDLAELTLGRPALEAMSTMRSEIDPAGGERSSSREVRFAAVAGALLAVHDLRVPGRSLADSIEARGGAHAVAELAIQPARAAAGIAMAGLKKRARRFEESLGKLEKAVQ